MKTIEAFQKRLDAIKPNKSDFHVNAMKQLMSELMEELGSSGTWHMEQCYPELPMALLGTEPSEQGEMFVEMHTYTESRMFLIKMTLAGQYTCTWFAQELIDLMKPKRMTDS